MNYQGTYSQRANEIVSHSTKKVYRFSRVDGSTAKGAALALGQMRLDDQAWHDAQTARNGGIPLTPKQVFDLVHGKPKAKAEPQVMSQPVDDGTQNHALKVLGELQAGLPERGKDQKSLKRNAIKAMEALAARNQARIDSEARLAELMSDPAIAKAIEEGTQRLDRLTLDPEATTADVDQARQILDTLKAEASDESTHGKAAVNYYASVNSHSRAMLDRFKAKRKEQETLLADLNERVRAGEINLVPEAASSPEQVQAAVVEE
jgi:hypothetical protein